MMPTVPINIFYTTMISFKMKILLKHVYTILHLVELIYDWFHVDRLLSLITNYFKSLIN